MGKDRVVDGNCNFYASFVVRNCAEMASGSFSLRYFGVIRLVEMSRCPECPKSTVALIGRVDFPANVCRKAFC